MADTKLTLGARVQFRSQLERVWVPRATMSNTLSGQGRAKRWKPQFLLEPREGIIIGIRTLSDGIVTNGDYGMEFSGVNHYPAYLVAYDVRRQPVFVFPQDVDLLVPSE